MTGRRGRREESGWSKASGGKEGAEIGKECSLKSWSRTTSRSVLFVFAVLSMMVTLVRAPSVFAASESASVEHLYSEWRFSEADRALAALIKSHPGEPGTLLAKGYERFMAGDFRAATAEY